MGCVIQVNVRQTDERIRPEELIPNHLLAVTIAEFHVAHHQDSVEDNSQRDDPEQFSFYVRRKDGHLSPVQDKHKSSEECYQKAEVTVAPDPDREGEEHAPDGGDVRETVQEDHPVHQCVLLYLQPDKYYDIDKKDCEIVGYEQNKIEIGHFPIRIDKNGFIQVNE